MANRSDKTLNTQLSDPYGHSLLERSKMTSTFAVHFKITEQQFATRIASESLHSSNKRASRLKITSILDVWSMSDVHLDGTVQKNLRRNDAFMETAGTDSEQLCLVHKIQEYQHE